MTAFYGDNNTLAYQNSPSSQLDVTMSHGRVRRAYDSYTLAAEATTADTIDMMKLPKGARIVDARFIAPSDGTTGQWNVGWTDNGTDGADADGLFIGSSAGDTGGGAVDSKLLGTRPGYNQKFSEETLIQLACAENTTASDGDTLELEVFYIVD